MNPLPLRSGSESARMRFTRNVAVRTARPWTTGFKQKRRSGSRSEKKLKHPAPKVCEMAPQASEKMAVALRVLNAITSGKQPERDDVSKLERRVPDEPFNHAP